MGHRPRGPPALVPKDSCPIGTRKRTVWGSTATARLEVLMRVIRVVVLALLCAGGSNQAARAQDGSGAGAHEGWGVTVYPVLVWVPLGISVDVDIPPFEGDAGGSGGIVDSHLDGAFFGGVVASNLV